MLKRQCFMVCCVVDGPAGAEMASKEHPDLVLWDVALGTMDHWEAMPLNKAAPDTATIPINCADRARIIPPSRQKRGSRLRGFRHETRRHGAIAW